MAILVFHSFSSIIFKTLRMRILQLFIPLLITSTVFAQVKVTEKVDIKWGPEVKIEKKSSFYDVLTFDDKGYYMLKSTKKGTQIDRYNKDLSLNKSLLLDLKYENKTMAREGITFFNNSIVVFSSFSDNKAKKNYMFYQVVDQKNLEQNGKLNKLSEISFEKKRRDGGFGYDKSPDSTKMMIYASMPYVKEGPEKFGFAVHDESMKEIWKKDIELPYKEELFGVEGYDVSNKGNVFITGIEYKERKEAKKRKGKPNHKYHILGYFDNGARVKDYEIDLGDKFVTDLTATVRDNEDLICTGFYSDNGNWSIRGTFFLTIDGETKKIKTKSFKEFDEDFITEGLSEREEAKAKKKAAKKEQSLEMYNYEFREMIQREDGGAVLIAEQYYHYVTCRTTTSSNGSTTTTCTDHYVYNDIIVINVSAEGQIEWASKIDKHQHSTNDGGYFSSFSTHVKGDKIFLVYNESAKQYYEKEKWKEMEKKDKKAMLTLLVEVDGRGRMFKELMFNNRIEGVRTRPKVCEQISSDLSIIYTKARKTQKFMELVFK
jgi:hypothetical protein